MTYNLWEILKPLENFIDFEILEHKITAFKDMVHQGLASDKVNNAVKNNAVSISAVFKKSSVEYKLVVKGIRIDEIQKNSKKKLSDIRVKDVEINGVSIIDNKNKNKIVGYIL